MTLRLLDLFCGAGGAAVGYHRAGFDEIVGVDNRPQPHYPFTFVLGDALEYVKAHGHEFDAIHASPPCQDHSNLRFRWGKRYESLIAETRERLKQTGRPYVIENVEHAPLVNPVVLCGTMFGLKVIRHRAFEIAPTSIYFPPAACSCRGRVGRRGHLADREYMTITGHFSNMEKAKIAMGIDWMSQSELSQAIPPAYTEWIGTRIMEASR